jgi:hypothetical protein
LSTLPQDNTQVLCFSLGGIWRHRGSGTPSDAMLVVLGLLLQVMTELEAVDDVVATEMSEIDAAVHRLNVIKQQQMELLLEAAKEREDVRFNVVTHWSFNLPCTFREFELAMDLSIFCCRSLFEQRLFASRHVDLEI